MVEREIECETGAGRDIERDIDRDRDRERDRVGQRRRWRQKKRDLPQETRWCPDPVLKRTAPWGWSYFSSFQTGPLPAATARGQQNKTGNVDVNLNDHLYISLLISLPISLSLFGVGLSVYLTDLFSGNRS